MRKIKAAIWTLVVLLVLALLMLCFTFYPGESFCVVMWSSCCLLVWAIYNIILDKLK